EDILAGETEIFKTWCVSVGGVSADSHVRRILNRIFGHEYSLLFNFTGRGGKKSYSKLAICPIVNGAVIESHKVTEQVVEDVCANFFRYAKDRKGGRSKRMKNL
ncbi:unnamed protein product, partial [Allacma fusca]